MEPVAAGLDGRRWKRSGFAPDGNAAVAAACIVERIVVAVLVYRRPNTFVACVANENGKMAMELQQQNLRRPAKMEHGDF